MTIAAFIQTPAYVIQGTGPYQISHPYSEGAIIAQVLIDSVPVDLDMDAITVTPASSTTTGDLYLSAAQAEQYAGLTLWIDRDTAALQGWEARYGDREVGMEHQLDRDTMVLQELRAMVSAALRGRTPLEAYNPEPNHVPMLRADGLGWTNGPSADEVSGAQSSAQAAQTAAASAASSATGSAQSAVAAGQAAAAASQAASAAGNSASTAGSSAAAAGQAAAAAAASAVAAAENSIGHNVALRTDFVSRNATGQFSALADGVTLTVEGLRYMRQASAATIPDLPGWVPVDPLWPEHYNINIDAQGIVTYNGVAVTYNAETVTYNGAENATEMMTAMLTYASENGLTIEFGEGRYYFEKVSLSGPSVTMNWRPRGGPFTLYSTKTAVDSASYEADYFVKARADTIATGTIAINLQAGASRLTLDADTVSKLTAGDSLIHIISNRVIETDDRGQARVGWTVLVSRIINSTTIEMARSIPMFLQAASSAAYTVTAVDTAARTITASAAAGQNVSAMRYALSFSTIGGAAAAVTKYPSEFDPTTGTWTFYSSGTFPTGVAVGDQFVVDRTITYYASGSVKANIRGCRFERLPHNDATPGDYGYRGLYLTRAANPELSGLVFSNFSEAGARIEASYGGSSTDIDIYNANRAYNVYDGTGYGISVFQSSWGIYRNIQGFGCRRTLDFAGTQMVSWYNKTRDIEGYGGGTTYDGVTRFHPVGDVEQSVVGSHGAVVGTIYENSRGIDAHHILNVRGRDEEVRGLYGTGTMFCMLNCLYGDIPKASGFFYSDTRPDWVSNPSLTANGNRNGKLTMAVQIWGNVQPNHQVALSDFHLRGLDMALVSLQDAPVIGTLTLGGIIDIAIDNETGNYDTFTLVRISGSGSPAINGPVDLGRPTIRNKPDEPKADIVLLDMKNITWGDAAYAKFPDGSLRFYLAHNTARSFPCNSVSASGVLDFSRVESTSPEVSAGVFLATSGRINTGIGASAAMSYLTAAPTGMSSDDGNAGVWFDASSGKIHVENRTGNRRLFRMKFSELAV